MSATGTVLTLQPLTSEHFAPFGEIIAIDPTREPLLINDGTAQRHDALGHIDIDVAGSAVLSLFRARPRALPFRLQTLERHPLGSQAFVPLHPQTRYVVVVAAADCRPQAFLAVGVGINLRRNVWHHPLLALDRESDFLVADRAGPGTNCEEAELVDGPWWLESPPA